MGWLIAGGIGVLCVVVLCVVAAVCVWTVIVLLAEAGDGRDTAAAGPATDSSHETDSTHETDREPRLENAGERKRVHSRADRY